MQREIIRLSNKLNLCTNSCFFKYQIINNDVIILIVMKNFPSVAFFYYSIYFLIAILCYIFFEHFQLLRDKHSFILLFSFILFKLGLNEDNHFAGSLIRSIIFFLYLLKWVIHLPHGSVDSLLLTIGVEFIFFECF